MGNSTLLPAWTRSFIPTRSDALHLIQGCFERRLPYIRANSNEEIGLTVESGHVFICLDTEGRGLNINDGHAWKFIDIDSHFTTWTSAPRSNLFKRELSLTVCGGCIRLGSYYDQWDTVTEDFTPPISYGAQDIRIPGQNYLRFI